MKNKLGKLVIILTILLSLGLHNADAIQTNRQYELIGHVDSIRKHWNNTDYRVTIKYKGGWMDIIVPSNNIPDLDKPLSITIKQ